MEQAAAAGHRIPGLTVLLPLASLRAIESSLGALSRDGSPPLEPLASDRFERHQTNEIARWMENRPTPATDLAATWRPALEPGATTWSTGSGDPLTVRDVLWGTADLAALGFPTSSTGAASAAQLGGPQTLGPQTLTGVIEERAVEAVRDSTPPVRAIAARPLAAPEELPWDTPRGASGIRSSSELDLNAPSLFPSLAELAASPRLALGGETGSTVSSAIAAA